MKHILQDVHITDSASQINRTLYNVFHCIMQIIYLANRTLPRQLYDGPFVQCLR